MADYKRWFLVMDRELVITGLLSAENEKNPDKAMDDILNWNVSVALDPAVSQAARDLMKRAFVAGMNARRDGASSWSFDATGDRRGMPQWQLACDAAFDAFMASAQK